MKNYKKLLVITLVVVGFGLTGCLKKEAFDQSKVEKTEQVGWIEFSKPDHKFSLKYPEGWEWKPEIDKSTLLTGFFKKEDPSQEEVQDEIRVATFPASYNLNIRVKDNKENLSAKEVVLKQYIPEGRADIEKTLEAVTIAGVEGVRVKNDAVQVNSSGPVIEYRLAPNNDKAYSFTYVGWAHPETHEKYLDEFQQILETLEFN